VFKHVYERAPLMAAMDRRQRTATNRAHGLLHAKGV